MITRVISAGRNDEPEFKLIQDVRPNDYFFMCTDGVLEQLYDELLEYHLRDNPDNQASPTELIQAIKEECEEKTNDNFSAYLIKIANVEKGVVPFLQSDVKEFQPASENKLSDQKVQINDVSQTSPNRNWIVVVSVFLLGTGYYFWQKKPEDTGPSLSRQVISVAEPVGDTVAGPAPIVAVKPKKKVEKKIAKPDKRKSDVVKKHTASDSVKNNVDPLHANTAIKEEEKVKIETSLPGSIVKSEKSDLPEKLKKVEPKHDY